MSALNETHDPGLRSWVESANDGRTDFPIQNLPLAIFRRKGSSEAWRGGVAIGDQVVDVAAAVQAGLFGGDALAAAQAAAEPTLNHLMSMGPKAASSLRKALSQALQTGSSRQAALQPCLVPQAEAEYSLPCRIGDYTDFYTSVHHATNIGKQFRPDNPLLPNYKWVPIGYHGRSSSIGVSGQAFHRPRGQVKPPDADAPSLKPSARLDIELEMGVLIGQPNALGAPIGIDDAESHVFGLVLFNDWSARDIQAWEYQPLGPFQAKATATTISPWMVMKAALEPFRYSTPPREVPLLPHLQEPGPMLYDIALEVGLTPEGGRETVIARTNYREMYYSAAQQLAHHTTSGCPMNNTGDLLGSGTISGPTKDSRGSLLELSWGGKEPIAVDGGTRSFIEDDDTLVLRGQARGEGYRIGFGECRGKLLAALEDPYARN